MRYYSTRDHGDLVTASQAIIRGLAPDGGLYIPESLPVLTAEDLRALCVMDYRARAVDIMGRFLDEFTREELEGFAAGAYADNFDDAACAAPLKLLDSGTGVLELWHGPTCAFKDMALQMLPRLLTASLRKNGEQRTVCILVATSGDTGKAALEGFADVEGTRILVFYPEGGVSDVQRLQMVSQTGGNVFVSAVKGNFDDAQTGVKRIFSDRDFAAELAERGYFLSSANSINWGRLLPQIVYYVSAYCDMVNAGSLKPGETLNFCVPTGNFGNILAGWYAKHMGLPVGRLICASNENNVLTDFIATGTYNKERPFHLTASPSMDILVSSNLERLLAHLCGSGELLSDWMAALSGRGSYTVTEAVRQAVQAEFSGFWCDDAAAKAEIARLWREKHYLMDTHTAVGAVAMARYRAQSGDRRPCVLVSTASPYKFCNSVLDALGEGSDAPGTVLLERLSQVTGTPVPRPLAGLAQRQERFTLCCGKADMTRVVSDFLR